MELAKQVPEAVEESRSDGHSDMHSMQGLTSLFPEETKPKVALLCNTAQKGEQQPAALEMCRDKNC